MRLFPGERQVQEVLTRMFGTVTGQHRQRSRHPVGPNRLSQAGRRKRAKWANG